MGYNGPVRRFDWGSMTSYVDWQATSSQRYTTTDWVHSNDGSIVVPIRYETSIGTRNQDIAEALRQEGYNPADFYSRTEDYAERKGDKDGFHTSSGPY